MAAAIVLLAAAAVYSANSPYARAASFIVRAAGVNGAVGAGARRDVLWLTESALPIETRHGIVRGRVYRPARATATRAVLIFAGVHPAGIDEPRLIALSRELAQSGLLVVTPELPDLVHLQITPRTVDMIEDATRFVGSDPALAADRRVGLIGISFSGALAIVAAGRPRARDHVAFVLSFGGYGDLPRVLRYLCTGREESAGGARVPPPHDYGVAIVLYGMATAMVPPAQVDALKRGIAEFIDASAVDSVDHQAAVAAFARARRTADEQPDPTRALLEEVNDRAAAKLGATLAPHLDAFGTDPALSPERSPVPSAPVFLLHGTEDNVIPAIESIRLERFLRAHGVVTHRLLSTLISHAEVGKPPTTREVLELVQFWAKIFKV